ncbi:MAG: hypothetical protein GYB65_10820 [Chloroflexi bacterium]|nr:hypothetical protein [Chloroflexota bacterium]
MAHILIIHAAADRFVAESVAERLRHAGHTPLLEPLADDTPSEESPDSLERGVVLLSPETLADPSVLQQIALVQARELPVMLLLVRTCTPTPELAPLPFVDFRRDIEAAYARLDRWLTGSTSAPAHPPAAPEFVASWLDNIAAQETKPDFKGNTLLGFPEPGGYTREHVVPMAHNPNVALAGARGYLERAGFQTQVVPHTDQDALTFVRGTESHARLLLVPSPRTMHTTVTLVPRAADGDTPAEIHVRWQVHVPDGVAIVPQSYVYWDAEQDELAASITRGEAVRSHARVHSLGATLHCVGVNVVVVSMFVSIPLCVFVALVALVTDSVLVVPVALGAVTLLATGYTVIALLLGR